jgi:bifunctional DNA-binding transcriptional regulator/antitoxin component of YhaV-PrlF toxin-antitoxin module
MLLRISKGGQISIPAPIRRRWATNQIVVEDHGDRLILRPAPDDPIERASGALKGRLKHSSREARRLAREDERIAEERKWGRF